jgi:hypothetical protein
VGSTRACLPSCSFGASNPGAIAVTVSGVKCTSRWGRALAVAIALAFGAAVVPLAAPGGAKAGCGPLGLSGCPTTTQPTVLAPVVTVGVAKRSGPRSLTVNGTVNPEGAATTYYFVVTNVSGNYLGQGTPTRDLAAGYSAEAVSGQVKVDPGESYKFTLEATNSAGNASVAGTQPVTMPTHPKFTIKLSARAIKLGGAFTILIGEGGTFDPIRPIDSYVAKAPYRRWVNTGTGQLDGRNRILVYPCPRLPQNDCAWLDRNFEIRADQGRYHSRGVEVYVYPSTFLDVVRENNNYSPYLDLTYLANVHRQKPPYPHPVVYFYGRSTAHGPFRRIGAVRMHARREYAAEQLVAKLRYYDKGSLYSLSCVRHQLVRDMGVPFTNRKCGSASIG